MKKKKGKMKKKKKNQEILETIKDLNNIKTQDLME